MAMPVACTNHVLVRTEELTSVAGGAICVHTDDEEVFLDAEVCASCRAVELVLHGDVAILRAEYVTPGKPCARCDAPTMDLGECVVSQGGMEIHAPLDRTWTFGLVSRVCEHGHVSLAGVGGQRVEGAPTNAELLARHERVATCACGGDVHALCVESHASGYLTVDDRALYAQICARCERVQLAVSADG